LLSTDNIWQIQATAKRNRDIKLKGINALNSDTSPLNLYCKLTSAVSNTPTDTVWVVDSRSVSIPRLNNSIFAFDSLNERANKSLMHLVTKRDKVAWSRITWHFIGLNSFTRILSLLLALQCVSLLKTLKIGRAKIN